MAIHMRRDERRSGSSVDRRNGRHNIDAEKIDAEKLDLLFTDIVMPGTQANSIDVMM